MKSFSPDWASLLTGDTARNHANIEIKRCEFFWECV